jgi:hypothetical protein
VLPQGASTAATGAACGAWGGGGGGGVMYNTSFPSLGSTPDAPLLSPSKRLPSAPLPIPRRATSSAAADVNADAHPTATSTSLTGERAHSVPLLFLCALASHLSRPSTSLNSHENTRVGTHAELTTDHCHRDGVCHLQRRPRLLCGDASRPCCAWASLRARPPRPPPPARSDCCPPVLLP